MIFRNRLTEWRHWLAAGQLCLVTGLLGQRFLHPAGDFWQGLVAGLSTVLIGASIVFNVRGMVLRRQSLDSNRERAG
jgi:hypothetical protein